MTRGVSSICVQVWRDNVFWIKTARKRNKFQLYQIRNVIVSCAESCNDKINCYLLWRPTAVTLCVMRDAQNYCQSDTTYIVLDRSSREMKITFYLEQNRPFHKLLRVSRSPTLLTHDLHYSPAWVLNCRQCKGICTTLGILTSLSIFNLGPRFWPRQLRRKSPLAGKLRTP